jgi:Fic family protein
LEPSVHLSDQSYPLSIQAFRTSSAFGIISQLVEIARTTMRLEVDGPDSKFGSDSALDHIEDSTAAALRLSGWNLTDRTTNLNATEIEHESLDAFEAAFRGYAELLRLVMAHHSEIPFLESQIKYFQSLLLKYDVTASSHRRAYRRSGVEMGRTEVWGLPGAPSAEIASREVAHVIAWARAELDSGEIPPCVVIALFIHKFLVLRPFADANGRLALALANYLLIKVGHTHLRSVSLEVAVEARRDECAFALLQSARGDTTPWVGYFLSIVADTQRLACEALAARRELTPLTPRQERLLGALRERGTAKIGDLIVATSVPRATAKKDLRRLLELGYIVATGIGKATVYHPGRRLQVESVRRQSV